MSSSSTKILLTSSDGVTFEIEEAVAHKLQIISHMIDDNCADKAIPLTNVTGDILAKVIEYCKAHVEVEVSVANESKEDDKNDMEEKLKAKDAEFMKDLDLEMIFKLILAANYLNCKELLDLTCQAVADHIKDKTVEEVREIFSIENDYTQEEEEAIRRENEWAFQ